MIQRLAEKLSRAPGVWVGAYALSAAFATYFCMYAFRKPFTVATYESVDGWTLAIDFKIAIVICQVLGYALSKFIGIKIVSEAPPARRAVMIIIFIAAAEAALVLFAVLPAAWKLLAIFLNGLPLGMIWGLVFSYLEGRRTSEILGAGLCASFILSSGVVKSAGRALIVDFGVPEMWMPAVTGLAFFPILTLSAVLLSLTPPPDEADRRERMARTPMYRQDRRDFFAANAFGLATLIAAYVVLTALRDFRDNFAVEIWDAVGFSDAPAIFTLSEAPIAAAVLALMALTAFIRNNKSAFLFQHWVIIAGAAVIAASTYCFETGRIGPVSWMIAVGMGLYIGYVPYNCILVDRMTAALGRPGNAAFFMYLADSSGYAGSVGLLLYKSFGAAKLSWLSFFTGFCYAAAAFVALSTLTAFFYFRPRLAGRDSAMARNAGKAGASA